MPFSRCTFAFRQLLGICILALAVLLPAAKTQAQGTSGILPDPIATSDLDLYAALLNLSAQQRQAIDPMHTQYLEQFATFRENEVGDFLEDTRNLRQSLMNPDGGTDISKTTRDHKRLTGRIESMDAQLFNQIQTVLSDEQLTELPRIRMVRKRQRYSTDATRFVTAMNPSVRVDLFAMINELELPAADAQAIDVPLRRYETQLTNNLQALHGATSGMFERISKAVQESVGTVDQSDPEQMRAMFTAFRTAWEQANVEVSEVAVKVSTLNRNTFENMTPLMTDAGRRTLQRNFYRRAYSTGFRNSGAADRRFDAALELTELTDETRSAIQQLRTNFESRHRTIASQLMDAIDEQRAQRGGQRFNFRRANNESDPGREKLDGLRDRLSALEDETLEQLNALLSAEDIAAIATESAHEQGGQATGEFVIVGATSTGSGGPAVVTFRGNLDAEVAVDLSAATDSYVPGPITRNDLGFYLETLETKDEIQAIVDSIYAEYRDSFQMIQTQYLEPLAEKTRESWSFRRRGGNDVDGPSPADVDQIFSLRREAMAEIQAMDEKFFGDIELLLSGDDITQARLRRIRQSRQRDIYNRGETGSGAMFFGGGRFRMDNGGQEERVDLTRAMRDLTFEGENQDVVESLLNTYSDAMTAALREQYETSLVFAAALQRAMAEMMEQRQAESGDDEENTRRQFRIGGQRMQEVNEQFGERRRQTTQRVIDLNRQTVDELRTALPENQSRDVRDAYYLAAFPSVYNDRSSAVQQLDAALELPNLTASQRSEILDITADYRGQYDGINLDMVRVQIEQPPAEPSTNERGRRGGDWQRMQELRNEMERLRFSRDELSEKARRRLRALLNSQQVDQIRGLTDEADEN